MGLVDGIRNFVAMRKFMKTPIAQALRLQTQEYSYGGSMLSALTDQAKQRLINGMTQQLAGALQSPNPIMAIREGLIGFSYQYAQVHVLSLTEDEKSETFYAENPYITGQLHHRIDEAAEHVEELAQHKWEAQASGQDLIDFANGRSIVYLYFMNAFNLARMEIGDKSDPDWFKPLVEADLVWVENTMREKLGLPLSVKDKFEALAYSSMSNMVENGSSNPFYEWCKTWPEYYLAGRGPLRSNSD
jgi:hypothetical protein